MLQSLQVAAGLHTEDSDLASMGRYVDGENVRFWKGLPEKIGGSQELATSKLDGPARGAVVWSSLNGTRLAAFGTACRLYVMLNSALFDITPRVAEGALLNAMSSTAGSSTFVIRHDAHGLETGQHITISTINVGGVLIEGDYTATVIDANNYTIEAAEPAVYTFTPTFGWGTLTYGAGPYGGGNQQFDYEYLIPCGLVASQTGAAYGAGPFGINPYSGDTRIFRNTVNARIWHLDSWGENLVATFRGGEVYEWTFANGVGTRAQLIPTAPANVNAIYTSDQDRILVALGATDIFGNFDPLLIRWSDQEDNTDFVSTAANYAGDLRCEIGSEIVGSVETLQGRLILTDTAAYLLSFIGQPFVYSLTLLDTNCGLAAPHGVISMDGTAYWMSDDEFFMYDGSVRRFACDLQSSFFSGEDDDTYRMEPYQRYMTYAGSNSRYDELVWHYAGFGSEEISRFIAVNLTGQGNAWSRGNIARTTWIDDNALLNYPIATKPDGSVMYHEIGYDDGTDPLPYHLETGDIEIGEGDQFIHISKYVPDFKRLEGTHELQVTTKDYPQGTVTKKVDITFDKTTKYKNPRARGRSVSYRFSCDELGNTFRLGRVRFDMIPDGERG